MMMCTLWGNNKRSHLSMKSKQAEIDLPSWVCVGDCISRMKGTPSSESRLLLMWGWSTISIGSSWVAWGWCAGLPLGLPRAKLKPCGDWERFSSGCPVKSKTWWCLSERSVSNSVVVLWEVTLLPGGAWKLCSPAKAYIKIHAQVQSKGHQILHMKPAPNKNVIVLLQIDCIVVQQIEKTHIAPHNNCNATGRLHQ